MKRKLLRRISIRNKGFTLIELLIVMTIIAVLVSIVVLALTGVLGAGEEQVCVADQRSLQTAVLAYYVANDTTWPTSDGLAPGDLVFEAVLIPDYVLEEPGSSADWGCIWEISGTGVVSVDALSPDTCPCQ